MHGPVAAVGPDVPAVLVTPPESDQPRCSSVPDLRRRGAPVLLVGPDEVPPVYLRSGSRPRPSCRLADPAPRVVPGQLLARRVAELRGVDVVNGPATCPRSPSPVEQRLGILPGCAWD